MRMEERGKEKRKKKMKYRECSRGFHLVRENSPTLMIL